MMYITVCVKEADFENYIRGEEIEAAKSEHKSLIFSHRDEIAEVTIPITDIVSRETKTVNGMVKGNFPYYIIKMGGEM